MKRGGYQPAICVFAWLQTSPTNVIALRNLQRSGTRSAAESHLIAGYAPRMEKREDHSARTPVSVAVNSPPSTATKRRRAPVYVWERVRDEAKAAREAFALASDTANPEREERSGGRRAACLSLSVPYRSREWTPGRHPRRRSSMTPSSAHTQTHTHQKTVFKSSPGGRKSQAAPDIVCRLRAAGASVASECPRTTARLAGK